MITNDVQEKDERKEERNTVAKREERKEVK